MGSKSNDVDDLDDMFNDDEGKVSQEEDNDIEYEIFAY